VAGKDKEKEMGKEKEREREREREEADPSEERNNKVKLIIQLTTVLSEVRGRRGGARRAGGSREAG
jgi:hypothetical protein